MPSKNPSKNKLPVGSVHPESFLNRFDQTWKHWTLKNGVRCIYVPLPKGDERFHLGLMVNTGSRFEDSNTAGLSHLLEHMMFRGSALYPSFSQLSEAFESLGGEWNAATGHEYTEYYYSGTSDKAEQAFRLLSDFTLRPALNDLETEKRIVFRELEGELNENGVSTDADYHILRTVWPNTSMAAPIIGTEESLGRIQLNDLKSWLQKYYTADRFVLTMVGGQAQSARELAQRYFSAAPNGTKPKPEQNILPTFQGPKFELIDNSDNEYDIQVSFVCEGTNSPKTPCYDMLSRILGDGFSSRLVKRVREELGLLYDISVGFHQYYGGGTFNISASISESNIEVFFSELFVILNSMSKCPPTPDEMRRHRTRALTDLMLIPSDPAHISFRLGWAFLTNADPGLDYWRRKIERTTPKKISEIASEVFSKKNLAVVALGPKDDLVEKRFRDAVFKKD